MGNKSLKRSNVVVNASQYLHAVLPLAPTCTVIFYNSWENVNLIKHTVYPFLFIKYIEHFGGVYTSYEHLLRFIHSK